MGKASVPERAAQGSGKGPLPSEGEVGGAALMEGSSQRPRIPDIVPAAWLDQLLVAVMELPLSSGESRVYEAMIAAVAGILPGYAVGACFVADTGRGVAEQVIVTRLPSLGADIRPGIDPTRVFPWLRREHAVAVPGTGATLHLASDHDELERDSSPPVHLLERVAVALARALAHCRHIASRSAPPVEAVALDQRMLQADKLATFGQIAAGLVHELNNPLTSIVAYSDYLMRKGLAASAASQAATVDPDDIERLRRITESANRMLRFTRDLVTYARPSRGMATPIVLHGVIDQAVAFCEHVLAGASTRVQRRYGADVLTVRGVSEQLVQVFVNLLTNAAQAAPEHDGVVTITTSVDAAARRIVIVVEDNGTGIATEHLPQVFAPFFTTKSAGHGTGLGLSIVKSIIESHEGEIRVESSRGHGTRFAIALPSPASQSG